MPHLACLGELSAAPCFYRGFCVLISCAVLKFSSSSYTSLSISRVDYCEQALPLFALCFVPQLSFCQYSLLSALFLRHPLSNFKLRSDIPHAHSLYVESLEAASRLARNTYKNISSTSIGLRQLLSYSIKWRPYLRLRSTMSPSLS